MSALGEGLRVTLIGINYAPELSGIAPYTRGIAEGLQERGHQVRVITTHPHYPQWKVAPGYGGMRRREQIGGVDVRRVRHYVPGHPQGLRRAWSEVTFGLQASSSSWGHPDVVICPSPALLSSAMVQWRTSAAFGLQIQDLYSAGMSERGGNARVTSALASVEGRVARKADGVAVIHDRLKERVVHDLGVDPGRVRVIRNWTHVAPGPVAGRDAVRRRLGWGDEFVVLHSGAIGEKQGLTNVIDAARLVDAEGSPFRFVLMGDGGQRAGLEAAARGLRSLSFLDPVPDAEYGAVLQAADALLVNERPGILEMAVPSKLTSYFATGKPVIAAVETEGATAEEVTAAGAGLRVEPGMPTALVETARQLASDPRLAAELGDAGPLYCDAVLSQNAALDHYDEWVRDLAARRP